MLQQFSWTQFLMASLLLTFLWYAVLFLTVYRTHFLAFFKTEGNASMPQKASMSPLPSKMKQDMPPPDFMGNSQLPQGMEQMSASELRFGPSASSEIAEEAKMSDEKLGLIPDVIQEFKEIFAVLSTADGNKADFFSLAAKVCEKYGRIGSNPNIAHINEFIRAHAPFHISPEEIENLWD